jgi:excinuclease UvrABC nuclease subunit
MKKSHQTDLIRLVKNTFPAACGVYRFYNAEGEVIYIGKSVSIRNRVLNHLRQTADEGFKWKGILSDNAGFIDYIVTNDELMALLIEDKLIKYHMPFFNVRQKHHQNHKYLGISGGLFPGLRVYGHSSRAKTRQIFGPFRNRYHIDLLLTLIQRYFRLRICNDVSPLTKCVYHDIELCTGPCTGIILPFAYTATVNSVVHFLNGNVNAMLHELKKDLRRRITGLEFENADQIRKMIEFCLEYSRKQFHYNMFKTKTLEIFNKATGNVRYGFYQGRMNYFADDETISLTDLEILENEGQPFFDKRILLDRSDIIYNWLNRHTGDFEYHFR